MHSSKKRAAKVHSDDALQLNGKLVALNPEVLTLWNFRRELLEARFGASSGAELEVVVGGELAVTADAIARNSKSYCAWYHRQWAVDRWLGLVDMASELALCGSLLQLDARNFHCWNYRRWAAERAAVPPATEIAYTLSCIQENFSNYSAWHYRTKLLERVARAAATPLESWALSEGTLRDGALGSGIRWLGRGNRA